MSRTPLIVALGLGLASVARAEIPLGDLAGAQVGLEGLVQWDINDFDNDRADLNGRGPDDREQGIRRTELVLKGRAKAGVVDWTLGYDAEAERALDANLRWKTRLGSVTLGQFKQSNGLEELSSTRSNDFVSKHTAGNLFALGRRLGVGWAREGSSGGEGAPCPQPAAEQAHGPERDERAADDRVAGVHRSPASRSMSRMRC